MSAVYALMRERHVCELGDGRSNRLIAPYPLLLAPALVVARKQSRICCCSRTSSLSRSASCECRKGAQLREKMCFDGSLVIGRPGSDGASRAGGALDGGSFGLELFLAGEKGASREPVRWTPGMCETQGTFTANVPASVHCGGKQRESSGAA